jgi:hypothetical protein
MAVKITLDSSSRQQQSQFMELFSMFSFGLTPITNEHHNKRA